MSEPMSNIGFTCEAHAKKAQPEKFGPMPLEDFIGKHVYLGFPCKVHDREPMEQKISPTLSA